MPFDRGAMGAFAIRPERQGQLAMVEIVFKTPHRSQHVTVAFVVNLEPQMRFAARVVKKMPAQMSRVVLVKAVHCLMESVFWMIVPVAVLIARSA